jgi:hypothetical protein
MDLLPLIKLNGKLKQKESLMDSLISLHLKITNHISIFGEWMQSAEIQVFVKQESVVKTLPLIPTFSAIILKDCLALITQKYMQQLDKF